MKIFTTEEWAKVQARLDLADHLESIINTPELIDFPKAVMLEAQHQEARWGTSDREGKTPAAWFWLLSHLATRALEHHKEAERIGEQIEQRQVSTDENGMLVEVALLRVNQRHHREKAAHHTITSAAVLAHWHASVIGRHTSMHPGPSDEARRHEPPAESQEAMA